MPRPATPEAAQRIAIAGQAVDYQLRRSRRRTIGLAIDHRGLRVSAPTRAPLADIETLLREHGQWVLDKLADWHERLPPQQLTVADGTVVSVLDSPLTVTVTPASRQRWLFSEPKLHLFVPPAVAARDVFEKALREKARHVFSERLAQYAPQLGFTPPPLRISAARTRWGSCSQHGGISLNWRLILMPLQVVDYVVCHELAHLREMNHSSRFWSVVQQLCPDWQTHRRELRQRARHLPQI